MKRPSAVQLALLACTFLLAACGSDPATCTISNNGDGTRMIHCPGAPAVRVVAGDANSVCTIGSGEDGGKAISCSDGTLVLIDKNGHVIFPGSGSIAGRAVLYGMADHAGIRVLVEGTEFETITAADGTYTLGPIPAGIHVLLFQAPRRVTERRENVPVINKVYHLDEVVLKFGRQVSGGSSTVEALPTGDAVLVYTPLTSNGGWLDLVELGDDAGLEGDRKRLGGIVSSHSFSGDGRLILYQERNELDGPLHLWDRSGGTGTMVAARSYGGAVVAGGEQVIYETRDEEGCRLHLWSRNDGGVEEIGGCLPQDFRQLAFTLFPDQRHILYRTDAGEALVRELATGRVHRLGEGVEIDSTIFLHDNRHVLLLQMPVPDFPSYDRVILDLESGEQTTIGSDASSFLTIAPDGDTLLFIQNSDSPELIAWRLKEKRSLLLGSASLINGSAFSPDGSRLLWVEDDPGEPQDILHVLELASPENRTEHSLAMRSAAFAGVGTKILLEADRGGLLLLEPATGTLEAIYDQQPRSWAWSPDRKKLAWMEEGGAVSLFDLKDGKRLVAEGNPGSSPIVWKADGSGIAFRRGREDGNDLHRWVPPAAPSILSGLPVMALQSSPAGTLLFQECNGSCSDEKVLISHDELREPIDAPVANFRLEHGLLIFFVLPNGAEEADRLGFYVMPMP